MCYLMAFMLKISLIVYLNAKHTAVRANSLFTLLAKVLHLEFMLFAFFFSFLVGIHRAYQMLYIVDESFAIGKTSEGEYFSAVRAF